MDAYKQSAFQDASVLESLESRMSWVYRRTGSAMAITSGRNNTNFLCLFHDCVQYLLQNEFSHIPSQSCCCSNNLCRIFMHFAYT